MPLLMVHWKLLRHCAFVLLITLLLFSSLKRKKAQQTSRKSEIKSLLNKYLEVFSLRRKILSASKDLIIVGGVECRLNDCLTKHLSSLPDYFSEVCSNNSNSNNYNSNNYNSNNYNSNNYNVCKAFSCLDVLLARNVSDWRNVFKNDFKREAFFSDYLYHDLSCAEMKERRGYVQSPLSNQSKHFPIAFNILAHQSAFQLENLLRSLYRPQNSYCIHVDANSSPSFIKAVDKIVECFPNVFLASTLQSIIYAGFSRLQADITCMSDHLKRSHPFKYLINTAAQAFPIRTNEEMVKILRIYNGANDIEGLYGDRLIKSRYATVWVENTSTHNMQNTRQKQAQPPHDIDIVRGSAYGIFSRGFVEFVSRGQIAKDFLKWSESTWSPDELYWASLHHTYSNPHLKTPGGFSGYPMDKRWMTVYANWGPEPCRGKFVRNVCVNGVEDLPDLIARKEFFVNKFYQDYQPLALYCVSSWMKFKESCSVPFDDSFYRSLNFIKAPL